MSPLCSAIRRRVAITLFALPHPKSLPQPLSSNRRAHVVRHVALVQGQQAPGVERERRVAGAGTLRDVGHPERLLRPRQHQHQQRRQAAHVAKLEEERLAGLALL
eukprot:358714-Chlamydomonas_euryale.AAC.3